MTTKIASLIDLAALGAAAAPPALGLAFEIDLIEADPLRLIRSGSNSFSLVAILAPGYPVRLASGGRFAAWPPVVWRLVDRGDRAARHGDIGCMELFGTPVIATDPFAVAGWLRGGECP